MFIMCKGLQRVSAEHQTRVTTGKVKELVDALCASMDRKFHRMEYNTVLNPPFLTQDLRRWPLMITERLMKLFGE